ncbi:aspartate/glutamate racemase family protein [Allopusillimonas ginsengisoli]|nr:aspartate/glutamate racemase family protein [Allopusillimonas ginsengisoli]
MTEQQFEGRFLGVLGGMGPMASAVFMARLTALKSACTEQEHVPAILWSDPRIPGRPEGYAKRGPDPLPWMLNGLRHLEQAGARAIVIPCNTAHLWYEDMATAVAAPILHIVDAVVADLCRQGVTAGRVGIMATETTLKLRLYQRQLEARGYDCLVLDAHSHARCCAAPIALVKENRFEDALGPVADGITMLKRQGAQAVVLACTELPLAIPLAQRTGLGIVVSDSIDALALAAIDWYEKESRT